MNYHLIPIKESSSHLNNENCKCNPGIRMLKNMRIITHKSFDGIEQKEKLLIVEK